MGHVEITRCQLRRQQEGRAKRREAAAAAALVPKSRDSLRPLGLQPARLLCPWDFPGKNTGVGCHFLLQGLFPTQGSNLRLLLGRQILYHRTSWEEVGGELAKQFVCGAGPQRCLETAPREAGATGPRGPGLCVSVEKGRGKAVPGGQGRAHQALSAEVRGLNLVRRHRRLAASEQACSPAKGSAFRV